MKKRIFIAGDVREYDSEHPEKLADEIKQYIIDHIVPPDCAKHIDVQIVELPDKVIRIVYPFTTGDELCKNTVSQPLYRCFTGEANGFVAENSLLLPMNFGPSLPMNVRIDVGEIAEAFRKNARFYKANRHKDFKIEELPWGMIVHIKY